MIYVARIDPDGLFRLYSYNTTRKDDWAVKYSVPIDRCSPKGICGLNSFCMNIDQDYACPCLPGFASVKDGNGNAGCERNFTAESCKNPTASYDMQPVSITIWENATQFCSKQKLPLRFGETHRREQLTTLRQVASSIAFAILMLAVSGLILHKNRGAFGTVYKGTLMKELDSSKAVAVKKLQKISSDGESEFQAEVIVMIKRIGSWSAAEARPDQYHNRNTGNKGVRCAGVAQETASDCESGHLQLWSCAAGDYLWRSNVDRTLPEEEVVLEEWVYSCFLAGELDKLVDYQTMDKKQLERMVKVALWCILEEP
ncbi:hypothetical protein NL676_019643 [Syzygium grande]|nr:hypothetical protein NL676_019643 [Syzygium grande]